MRINHYARFMKPKNSREIRLRSPQGVALILVLLSMLVLSVLAASIVFTARSETFASYNYRLDTQADYLAKAGIQRTINWIESSEYQPARPDQAFTYYYVTAVDPTNFPNLYTSDSSPVKCRAVANGCPTGDAYVQLIGYGTGISGSSSNYPDGITNSSATKVSTAFTADLNDPGFAKNRVSGDAANSGYYVIDATLINYQTVNVSPAPSPIPSSCVGTTIVTCPMETWLITAKATWTGSSSSSITVATAEETAIVQPIYWPTYGNALYGFCSVQMSGSSGVCTDAFNSSFGAYAGGSNKTAAKGCDSNSTNVIDTGAGVGANGHVDLGSNVTVGGNVTIGTGPTGGSSCCVPSPGSPACGYNGSVNSVNGEVINGPHINPPGIPGFAQGPPGPTFPASAPNVTLSGSGNQTLPGEFTWSNLKTSGNWPYPLKLPASPTTYPTAPNSTIDCLSPGSCSSPPNLVASGTASNPYTLGTIKMTGSGELDLVGGSSPANPVYYDIDQLSQQGGTIVVSGYVVLNVKSAMDIEGNGITGSTAAGAEIPPEGVQINYAGTSAVKIGGNGAVCALINAPNADVTLKGGGSGGYMIGSIQANNVIDQGGFPVHYDVQLSRKGGTLGTIVSTAYSRKKM